MFGDDDHGAVRVVQDGVGQRSDVHPRVPLGAGAAALGNPARCVAWLANKLATFGAGLRAGDVVLPGAVHAMVPVRPGDVFRAEFAYLGAVTARFSSGEAAS